MLGPAAAPCTVRSGTLPVRARRVHVRSLSVHAYVVKGKRRVLALWTQRDAVAAGPPGENQIQTRSASAPGVQVAAGPSPPNLGVSEATSGLQVRPGNYYLAGRKSSMGTTSPARVLPDAPFTIRQREDARGSRRSVEGYGPKEEQASSSINRREQDGALTLLAIPSAPDREYTSHVWLDFLPSAWLVLMRLRASMTMVQRFQAWGARIRISRGLTLALDRSRRVGRAFRLPGGDSSGIRRGELVPSCKCKVPGARVTLVL